MTLPHLGSDNDHERRLDEALGEFLVSVEGQGVPSAAELIGRNPDLAADLERFFVDSEIFDRLTQSLRESVTTQDPFASPKHRVANSHLATGFGDYEIVRVLGRGGMGTVYEAIHKKHGNRVALKTLPQVDGARLYQFKREFRALADVNHPNLIGLHTLESDGQNWFFTMDVVDGVDFLSYVRPGGVLDLARLQSSLPQLVSAVRALHDKGIIHRDLKPPNVMVSYDSQIRVLDFGLVLESDQSWSGERVAGTPKYMAPEQCNGEQITGASDWYAIGVMLYEAFTGQGPFEGKPFDVFLEKQGRDAPPLPDDLAVPADLIDLTNRLLRRNPHARPTADQIVRVVATTERGLVALRPLHETVLVGRDRQLKALDDAYDWLCGQRQPIVAFVRGRSGEGKSILVERFLEPLRARKEFVAVMSGRCYDRESVPFKALDSLIDALCSYLRSLPETDAALLMPDDMGVLAQVFPVLQRAKVVALASGARLTGLDDHQVRQRAFRALRSLLNRISRRALVIWFTDDLQWGDADSAEALFEVLRSPDAPAVLFLGTYRSDEASQSAFLTKWEELKVRHNVAIEQREIEVGPLTATQCVELFTTMYGKDNEAIRHQARQFADDAGGNPFLLIELFGCFDSATDSFHLLPIHEVIQKRLRQLPADAPRLLEVLAVSGQALSIPEAARAVGNSATAVATLTRMRNERLVRLTGTDDRPMVDTYHDRIRETVQRHLADDMRQSIHKTLADIIEQDVVPDFGACAAALQGGARDDIWPIPRVYDLSYHYDAAGEQRKAWIYALWAARQARQQFATEVAMHNFAIAQRNAAGTSNAIRYQIVEGLGEALQLLGRYAEADHQLEGAIDLVDEPLKKARIDALLGDISLKQGKLDQCVRYYDQSLRRLGVRVPRTWIGLTWDIVCESAVQSKHYLTPWRLHQLPSTPQREQIVVVLGWLADATVFQSTLRMVWAVMTGLNRAEMLPPSPRTVLAVAFYSCMVSLLGWQSQGVRYGQRSMLVASAFDDLWGFGYSCNYQGIGLHAAACYDDGIVRLGQAINAFEKAGDQWQLNLARFHRGCCYFGLGNLAAAIADARWVVAASARLDDSRILCSSYLWARAADGDIPFEELRSCFPCRPDDVMSTVHGTLSEALWHTHHRRTAEALTAFEHAALMVRKTLCLNSHTILVMPLLARGLRLHADAIESTDPHAATILRKRARRITAWSTKIFRWFPAAYPLALRERAENLAVTNRLTKALAFADKSCSVAAAQGAKFEYAQSLLVRGTIAARLGRPDAKDQIRSAEAALARFKAEVQSASAGAALSAVVSSNSIEPGMGVPTTLPPKPPTMDRHRFTKTLYLMLFLVFVVGLGHVVGSMMGYTLGFVMSAVSGNLAQSIEIGQRYGAGVTRIALPVLFLVGGILVRHAQKHYQAELIRNASVRPRPPSILVRIGLNVILGILILAALMISAALGIWISSYFLKMFALSTHSWAPFITAIGGGAGLALPLILWWRRRHQ